MPIIQKILSHWNSYKYRFVPWLKFRLRSHKTRVTDSENDRIISDTLVLHQLHSIYEALEGPVGDNCFTVHQRLFSDCGFALKVKRSTVSAAGQGVFVSEGKVSKGTVVALYPGTVYRPYEPIFFQSVGNPYIFQCSDYTLIDGNHKRLSKVIFKSCAGRDRIGPYQTCDTTWLHERGDNNYLNIGQIVNNQTSKRPANICYQEFDFPEDFPILLRKYIPNVFYQGLNNGVGMRTVVLVSTRDISAGEELFSTYYTVIKQ